MGKIYKSFIDVRKEKKKLKIAQKKYDDYKAAMNKELKITSIQSKDNQSLTVQVKEQLYNNLLEKITDLNSIYDEIRIKDIEKKLPEEIKKEYRTILKKDLTTLIEEMILKADINARIRGDYLTFIKKDLIVKPEQQKLQQIKDAVKSTSEDLSSLEVICKNCESIIIVTDSMKSKDFIICEDCGEEIEIGKHV